MLISAVIRKGEMFYIAECIDIDVVTQGGTIDEAIRNLREAVDLYFEDEDKRVDSDLVFFTTLEVGSKIE